MAKIKLAKSAVNTVQSGLTAQARAWPLRGTNRRARPLVNAALASRGPPGRRPWRIYKPDAREAPTVKDLCGRSMPDNTKVRNKPSTQKGYLRDVSRNIILILGRMMVQDVKRPTTDKMSLGPRRFALPRR